MLSAGSAVVQSTAVDWNHTYHAFPLPPVCKITTVPAQHPPIICKLDSRQTQSERIRIPSKVAPIAEGNPWSLPGGPATLQLFAQRARRPQLAGAGGDITSPDRPRDPGLASPAPSRRRGLRAQCPAAAATRSSQRSAEPRAGASGPGRRSVRRKRSRSGRPG